MVPDQEVAEERSPSPWEAVIRWLKAILPKVVILSLRPRISARFAFLYTNSIRYYPYDTGTYLLPTIIPLVRYTFIVNGKSRMYAADYKDPQNTGDGSEKEGR
jgi:hypothetical protein